MNHLSPKGFFASCLFFLAAILFNPATGFSLVPMDNEALEEIIGNAGFSIAIANVEIFNNLDTFHYQATDNDGFLQFLNFRITDGNGGPARYNFNAGTAGLIHFDVATVEIASPEDWKIADDPTAMWYGMIGISVPEWDQEVAYMIPELIFSGPPEGTKSLGSIGIGPVHTPSYHYFLAPHGSGIDWEYGVEMHIDNITYEYQVSPTGYQLLNFENIHIGSSFDYGTIGDDPADPSTWKADIGRFKIGDMFGDLTNNKHSNPARFDVGTREISPGVHEGSLGFLLPMSGSIRFENVEFGNSDFGPGAIDGIEAHRLEIHMTP